MNDYRSLGYDKSLRKTDSIATGTNQWRSALEQELLVERTPYGNPTNVVKGLWEITQGGTLIIKDATGGTNLFAVNPTTGSITHRGNYGLTGNMSLSGTLSVGGSTISGAYSRNEIGYMVTQGGREFTGTNDWIDVNGSRFRINGDTFILTDVYFQILGCVEQAGRTGYCRIWNITGGSAIPNGTVTWTAVGTTPEYSNSEIVRSGTIGVPTGVNDFKLQYKQSDIGTAGDNIQLLKAHLIYQL